MKKEKTLTQLKREAWKWFSRYIKIRDNWICFTCGKDLKDDKKLANAGHYVPQSKGNKLRFYEYNVHCQCVSCNHYQHGNLYTYALKLIRKYGYILEELETIHLKKEQYTREELLEIIDYSKMYINQSNDETYSKEI